MKVIIIIKKVKYIKNRAKKQFCFYITQKNITLTTPANIATNIIADIIFTIF